MNRYLPFILRVAAFILVMIALPPLVNYAYQRFLPVVDEYSLEDQYLPASDLVQLGKSNAPSVPTQTPFSPQIPTSTQLEPTSRAVIPSVQPTTAATAIQFPTSTPWVVSAAQANPAPRVSSSLNFESGDFFGINFTDRQRRITIKIIPAGKRVNGGKPIVISFIPGKKCEFGNKRACVNLISTPADGPVTFLSIHSGVGGEAQPYRSAIEGTGLDRALFSLKQVQANLNALSGSEVVISQGEHRVSGLKIVAITRIPAKSLNRYIKADLNNALEFAAGLDGEFEAVLQSDQPQVVFETCGWKMPGEPNSNNVSSTSASIYLTVIQKIK